MSRQFKVKHLFYTTGPAVASGHDGQPYVNRTYPAGSVFAVDELGDLFAGRPDVPHLRDNTMLQRKCWPNAVDDRIVLFRDHWCFVMTAEEYAEQDPSRVSPYNAAIRNAPKRTIWRANDYKEPSK